MQYYTFLLDKASHNLCSFATPFGLYHYCWLPMGASESLDIASEKMHSVLDGIDGIEFYRDDIGFFSDSWDDHLSPLSIVLTRLQEVGFTINQMGNMGCDMLVCHYHNQHNHICLTNKMLLMIVDWFL